MVEEEDQDTKVKRLMMEKEHREEMKKILMIKTCLGRSRRREPRS